ncbi:hypothetical protein BDZ91DRAFT_752610 [Kalaharituber pfeilii]|nr:hypothetical protein BDZ91DRAFT_752610 [Kalaharituber pfeilii]
MQPSLQSCLLPFCVIKSSLFIILVVSLTATPFYTFQPRIMVTAAAQRQRASLSDDTLRLAHHRPGPTSKVTFRVANLDPENYYGKKRNDWEPSEKKVNRTSQQILTLVDRDAREQCKEIVYSSLDPHKNHTNLIPAKNGFVGAVIRAYAGHFHLEIRPDDVWIAILTQLSLFINADPERFRGKFVAFEGKRNLTVVAIGSRATLNYGLLAVEMGKLLQENVVDPELREWIVPQFTTTTLDDTIASSMIMMSTLKEFFNYEFKILCGIPSVTLHGEKKDWEVLLQKVEKLKNYGLETTMWYHLLEPILSRFVKAWDDPEGEWNQQFWARVATTQRPIGPCGTPRYITGWITAFMPFNNEGKWHLKSALPHLIPVSEMKVSSS